MGNIVRRVLHIIREEDLASTTTAIGGLGLAFDSDDDEVSERNNNQALSAVAVAAAARNTLRAPSLYTLLEDASHAATIPPSSSGGDSEGRSRCMLYNCIIINNYQ